MRILVALVCLAVIGALCAAPKGRPEPALVGEFDLRSGRNPVVLLPADDGESGPRVYWLVFADPAAEVQARKVEPGKRVAVWGVIGAGGEYRYVIATAVKLDE